MGDLLYLTKERKELVRETFSPTDVANSFLELSFTHNVQINAMKLQRLIALAAMKHREITNMPMFYEPFHTWSYGPVNMTVHAYFQDYRNKNLEDKNVICTYIKNAMGQSYAVPLTENSLTAQIILEIWNTYKYWNSAEISRETQAPGTPWDVAFQNDEPVFYI